MVIKIQSIAISSKNSCNYILMSSACTPILVSVTSPVSEILLPSRTAKFFFPTMDYSPWSSKNSMDQNRLKNSCNYKLVSNARTPILVSVTSPVSEILLPSRTAKFPFPTMGFSQWSSKSLMDWNQLKKFMQL